MDDLILLENLGFRQNSLVSEINRIAIDRKVPVLEDLLLHEKTDETVDVSHLLLGVYAADSEAITHAWTGTNAVRHTINTAELRWQMNHLISMFHDDKRLSMVRDVLVIHILHVL